MYLVLLNGVDAIERPGVHPARFLRIYEKELLQDSNWLSKRTSQIRAGYWQVIVIEFQEINAPHRKINSPAMPPVAPADFMGEGYALTRSSPGIDIKDI